MKYLKNSKRLLRHAMSTPIIYSVLVPVMITDLWVEFYHRTCFPLYGLPYVKRGEYIKIDRHKLKYLTPLQKMNCVYCGYMNGVFGYWVRVAGDTEQYWCGVQHKKSRGYKTPPHHKNFTKYGDKKEFAKKYLK